MAWRPPDKVNKWRPIVDKWACEIGVSQALVLAVIQMESGGNEKAYRYEPGYFKRYIANNATWQKIMKEKEYTPQQVSASYGLMQLMYPTAMGYSNLEPEELFDPNQNVRIGTAYLANLLKKYKGNIAMALAHYNGGSGGARAFKSGANTRATRYAKVVHALYRRYVDYHVSLKKEV